MHQGSKLESPSSVRRIPSPFELLDKGLLVGEGRVRSRRHRASPTTARQHGRSEHHEKTLGVSRSKERPRHGKSFKLSPLSLCYIIIFLIIFCFLFTATFPLQAVQATFRATELVNFTHRQMKDEEGRRIAVVEGFNMAKKRIKELNTKLTKADRKIKSIEAALERAES